MARKKKITREQVAQAMAFLGGLTAPKPDEGMGVMDIFAKGLMAGVTIGREQARAEQRKKAASENA